MGDRLEWEVVDIADEAQATAVMGEVLTAPGLCEQIDLAHDLRWLRTLLHGGGQRVAAATLRHDGVLVGFASLLQHPSALRLTLGEMTVLSRPILRWTAVGPPCVALPRAEDAPRALETLFRSLQAALGQHAVFYLEGLPEVSPLADLLRGPRRQRAGLHALMFGPAYSHRAIELTDSYESYLRTLNAKTREDLRRTRRRFGEFTGGEVELRRYERPEQAEAFLDAAIVVSEKTWQFHQMGAGLRDRAAFVTRFQRTAALGWFRSYVLFASGRPVAFQVGHLYRQRFHAQDIGYDPETAKWNPGIFLHTEILPDLLRSPGVVTAFDFGQTDSVHKARLSNRVRREMHYYLLPPSPSGALTAGAMRASNALSAALGTGLDRLGIRRATRELLRRLRLAR